MPCCLLRVSGADFDPDAFLATSSWQADNIYRRGEKRSAKQTNESSGITVLVSDESEFKKQVEAATAFLQTARPELERVLQAAGIESVMMDFGVVLGSEWAASFFNFPASLLREAAALSVEVELSVYRGE